MTTLHALKNQSQIPCTNAEECLSLGSRIYYQMLTAMPLASSVWLLHYSQKWPNILCTVPRLRSIGEAGPLDQHSIFEDHWSAWPQKLPVKQDTDSAFQIHYLNIKGKKKPKKKLIIFMNKLVMLACQWKNQGPNFRGSTLKKLKHIKYDKIIFSLNKHV